MKRRIALLATLISALVLVGCGPKYPKCDNDDDCASNEKGQSEGNLYCVNGLCQQCREDVDCGDDSMECNAGVCDKIPGYCSDVNDCPGNQKCRDNRCGAECTDNSECESGKCDGGDCVAAAECSGDADCPSGQVCENGACRNPADASCSLDPVFFDYDSSTVDDSGRGALQNIAQCVKTDGLSVRVEGHADERGSNEYNIALGERRARAVYKYLRSLGVEKSKMDTISYGEENPARSCGESGSGSCHRQNRRVEIKAR